MAAFGIQSAGVSAGGDTGVFSPQLAVTETFNGSTWTNSGNLNTARSYLGGFWYSIFRSILWWERLNKCNRVVHMKLKQQNRKQNYPCSLRKLKMVSKKSSDLLV